jgi:hypothetical protein
MSERTFEYNGVKITVQAPNGFSRIRKWTHQAILNDADLPDDIKDPAVSGSILFLLANTVAVDGDLGFPVPLSKTECTPENLTAFIMGLGCADDTLILDWDSEIVRARVATNDPDLLPPSAVEKKGEKT